MSLDWMLLLQYFMLGFLGIFTGLFIAAIIYYFAQQHRQLSLSAHAYPLGRKEEIDFLVSRIKTGQSSVVIGLFSNEKTEILGFLTNNSLYEEQADNLFFSNVDIALYPPDKFWALAMQPLQDVPELAQAYEGCEQNQFSEASLRRLINLLHQSGKRLVLLLNNFHEMLRYPPKDQAEFFATLRSLASSRHPSPLAVVAAINQSLMEFHRETEKLNPSGSPYLNFMEGGITILKGLSEQEVDELLAEISPPLSAQAKQQVKRFAGGSPYLLQVATSEFLKETASVEEFESDFFKRMELGLTRMLHGWSLSRCQALLAIIQKTQLTGFEKELRELAVEGFIAEIKGEWQLRAEIFRKIVESKSQQDWCQPSKD